jgi:hypothetical protein
VCSANCKRSLPVTIGSRQCLRKDGVRRGYSYVPAGGRRLESGVGSGWIKSAIGDECVIYLGTKRPK